jgi:choline dehydrogenase-like flavoprotein
MGGVNADPEVLAHADVAVLGGGTAGAIVAGVLVESTPLTVAVIEAGPDYGPSKQRRWPAELLDSLSIPVSHDWGYDSGDTLAGRTLLFERARVISGCSAHNGCAQTVGWRGDYDAWGLPGCDAAAIEPHMRSAARRLRVRHYREKELTPFQGASLSAMQASGIPRTDDLDDLDGGIGCGPSPFNNPDGIRWNTAFAYLDPVRDSRRLRVSDRAVVDRIEVTGSRARRVQIVREGERISLEADRFVVCAGAYGSPAVLLRSGIGHPDELRALGIDPSLPLAGVGRNLHDHPTLSLRFRPSDRLLAETERFGQAAPVPQEQVIAKALSRAGPQPFDLHLFPYMESEESGWACYFPAACLTPRSRGSLRLRSSDPQAAPLIDHAYLSDPEGEDLAALREGLGLWREMLEAPALAPMVSSPLDELSAEPDPGESMLRTAVAHYWHPVGTCAMGADPDDGAVVDASGRLHGCENAWVIDASTIPVTPRATTNLPVAALAEHLASTLE